MRLQLIDIKLSAFMQLHAVAFICLLHQYINFHFNLLFIWLRYISVLISNINEKYTNALGVGRIFDVCTLSHR